jgi:hypothetical protein
MKTSIVCLFAVSIAVAGFGPNVRIDRLDRPSHACLHPSIVLGPGAPSRPSIYVVYEDDSLSGFVPVNTDLVLQKSTDGGATWLAEDRILRHYDEAQSLQLDVMADPDGNVYIAHSERDHSTLLGHIYCLRSTDGGVTWSAPVQVDDNAAAVSVTQARITTDSAGNLFCAWGDGRIGRGHIWSSLSTDRGTTWSANVRVSTDVNDTTRFGCMNPDVFVQPGTNQYLVAAECYYLRHPVAPKCAFLYRSTDGGRSFQPGFQLDTFYGYTGKPHVVADRDYIICDYTGAGESISGYQSFTESRTFYSGPDTWGAPVPVTVPDTIHSSYYNGARLALSADGRVHTALEYGTTLKRDLESAEGICYTYSTDHGASWTGLAQVNDSSGVTQYPDIGADSAGYAYVVWDDGREHRNEIWFATNNPLGVAEGNPKLQATSPTLTAEPSIFSRTTTIRLSASSLITHRSSLSVYDASGRLVRSLSCSSLLSPPFSLTWDGRNSSGTRCPAGLYVLRCGTATTKVTLLPAD